MQTTKRPQETDQNALSNYDQQDSQSKNLDTTPELTGNEIVGTKGPLIKNWRAASLGVGLTALIGVIATIIAPLPGLSILGSLTVALLLGMAWRSVAGVPKSYTGGVQFSAKKLLRYGIILTGVRLNFGLIVSSGLQVLLLDIALITFGVCFIPWLGRRLGLNSGLALLIGVGQSICGASAVGAVAPLVPDADEDSVSLAVAICGLLGTIGVLFYSITGPLLGWSSHLYGMLSGSTLHEIAQVVAAGPAGGPGAADLAMVVKLTRVMLLAPVAVIITFVFMLRLKQNQPGSAGYSFNWKKLPIPWFVLGFLAVGAITSLNWLPKDLANVVLQISVFLMVMAMAAMGLMVDLTVIRKTGLKASGVAALGFTIFITVSFLLITTLGL